ncbi:MAG TPA: sulfite exporter TauE/SafE family protein [Acidimicrobiales bacterium]|nr:sulfite exporter TauE/SafE family protein [Acidimicrobiales bacterium]
MVTCRRALSVPTLVSHWLLGHVDWTLAGDFAAGMLPGAAVASQLAQRIHRTRLRLAFGLFLVVFSMGYTAYGSSGR